MQNRGEQTRTHILKESRRLFTVQGFQNTSISQIIAATGVKKGNLYYHFPSKEELGIAVLADARDEFLTILDQSLSGEDPRQKILNSCNRIMELMQQSNFVGGCLFGNTALEMTDSNSRFGKIIQDVFSRWIDRIEQELQQAATAGIFKSPVSANALATSIVALLEGGIMLSRVYNDKNSLKDCIRTVRTLLLMQD